MDIQQIISVLRDERDRLEEAISALEGTGARRGRRRLSAASKKRISIMMKKRWAERKKALSAA
ncbi:MAG TPA: hypothetical protein VNW97_06315 [Candidatus Saccharimonadales bacterium]|jgi:hypothetical protein|nr:hypothetical protein [Candidatus Saccharimonadales bacterium]